MHGFGVDYLYTEIWLNVRGGQSIRKYVLGKAYIFMSKILYITKQQTFVGLI